MTGPIPGTLCKICPFSRHCGSAWISLAISAASSSSSACKNWMCFFTPTFRRVEVVYETVLLGGEHGDHLAPTSHRIRQMGFLFTLQGTHPWSHSLSKVGQHVGMDSICFGQTPISPGKVPHPAGVDHRHRQTVCHQRQRRLDLVTATGFQHDQGWVQWLQTVHQFCLTGWCIGIGMDCFLTVDSYLQAFLGYIDAYKIFCRRILLSGIIKGKPTLADTKLGPGNCSGFHGLWDTGIIAARRFPGT